MNDHKGFSKKIICDPDRLIKKCRVCDSLKLEPAINLGFQPWCNNFLKKDDVGEEEFYPLRVVFCTDCSTPQLDYTVPKEIMFSEHTYLSSITKTLGDHFELVATEVDKILLENSQSKSVLDIGSNDGVQLKHFKKLGYDVLGVESAKTPAKIANESGIPTMHDFFNLDFVKKINRKFNVINAAGVFFHLEELHSACDGIKQALSDDGIFVVQFLYMKRIVENLAFDQIYHEHLLYYNLKNIETLLNRHDLSLFDAHLAPIHGGSIIAFATHKGRKDKSPRLNALIDEEIKNKSNDLSTYLEFAQRIEFMKKDNLHYLSEAKKSGKKIFGFGAPAKGNTLLNYFEIGTEYLDCLVEKNELRENLYSPGMHVPVVMEKAVQDLPDIYYVLAWNFKKEILENNQNLINQGVEFYFPVNPKE
jgi:SAM-dependent methyltransferase